jgi:acyl-CoA synthetase (AMP-forming)/AMP-acid ligase II/ABC-type nitrate/sulfonate/bicarbonate transport system permease component
MIVGKYLQRQALEKPDKVAIICNEVQMTFADLNLRTNRLANWLLAQGVKKGDRAVMLLPNCAEFAVVYFALMKLGVVAVILDVRLSPAEMAPIFDETEAKVIITHAKQKNFALRMLREKKDLQYVVLLGDEGGAKEKEEGVYRYERIVEKGDKKEPDVTLREEDEALYLYTSGTTGKPKGVILTYDHLTYFPETMKAMKPISGAEVQGSVLPMSHISGPIVLNLLVEAGHTIAIIDEIRPKKILEEIERNKINYFHAVPPIYKMILNLPNRDRYDVSSLNYVSMMGTVVPEELMEEWVEEFPHCRALQGYGATETSPLLTLTHYDDAPRKMASAGRVAPRAEIKIVDKDGKELPTGEVGEVIARGPQIMKGYFKNAKATADKIKDGWYYTGDLGRFDEDGYIYILGRADDMIIIGGMNVYPSELENVLIAHDKVAEVAVVGIQDAERGQALKAVVVPKVGEEVSKRELMRFCRERLATFKLPKTIEFRDSLPRSRTGKVAKRELKVVEEGLKKYWEFLGDHKKWIGPVALVAVWLLVTLTKMVDPFFLPSPYIVGKQLGTLLLQGVTYEHIVMTFYRMMAGYAIAVGIGVPLGIVLGYWEKIYESVEFIIDFFRSFPATAMFPLFMLAFGLGDGSKIALVVFGCALLILVNTTYGVHGGSRTRKMVAETMKASETYIMAKVVLPEALPQIAAGLRLALSLSLIIVVVLEMFIGTTRGLGYLIYNAHMTYQIADMYAYIVLAGLIGYFINQGFVKLEDKVIHWAGR